MRIKVAVQHGDALTYEADVLVVKHAQALYGLDEIVHDRLAGTGEDPESLRPSAGSFSIHESNSALSARWVLIIGTVGLSGFGYREIREFSRRALAALAEARPDVSTVAMTLHGANYGLDELEAFQAEVAGLIDGITAGRVPNLDAITFVEASGRRVCGARWTLSFPTGTSKPNWRDSWTECLTRAAKNCAPSAMRPILNQ